MKHYLFTLCIIAATILSSCSVNSSSEANSNDLKEYIIVRYGGLNIKYNDGTTRDEQVMKDANGNELEFNSLTGVINYMTSQGWKLEEVVAEPQYNLYSQDANLIFSKPTTMPKLKELVDKSLRK